MISGTEAAFSRAHFGKESVVCKTCVILLESFEDVKESTLDYELVLEARQARKSPREAPMSKVDRLLKGIGHGATQSRHWSTTGGMGQDAEKMEIDTTSLPSKATAAEPVRNEMEGETTVKQKTRRGPGCRRKAAQTQVPRLDYFAMAEITPALREEVQARAIESAQDNQKTIADRDIPQIQMINPQGKPTHVLALNPRLELHEDQDPAPGVRHSSGKIIVARDAKELQEIKELNKWQRGTGWKLQGDWTNHDADWGDQRDPPSFMVSKPADTLNGVQPAKWRPQGYNMHLGFGDDPNYDVSSIRPMIAKITPGPAPKDGPFSWVMKLVEQIGSEIDAQDGKDEEMMLESNKSMVSSWISDCRITQSGRAKLDAPIVRKHLVILAQD